MKNCLVILHKSCNSDIINLYDKLYAKKYDTLFHICPPFLGQNCAKPNVINVFESKVQLSGYVAQAREKLLSNSADNFIFLIEGSFINPKINTQNFTEFFNLPNNMIFFNEDLFPVDLDCFYKYDYVFPSVFNFRYSKNGAQIKEFIPKKGDMRKLFQTALNIVVPRIYTHYTEYLADRLYLNKKQSDEFYYKIDYGNLNIETLTKIYDLPENKEGLSTIYPFISSNSTMMIVPKTMLEDFAHYCGMFAAIRLHYNIAFAMSAFLTSYEKIKTKKDFNNPEILNYKETASEKELLQKFKGNINSYLKEKENYIIGELNLSIKAGEA